MSKRFLKYLYLIIMWNIVIILLAYYLDFTIWWNLIHRFAITGSYLGENYISHLIRSLFPLFIVNAVSTLIFMVFVLREYESRE